MSSTKSSVPASRLLVAAVEAVDARQRLHEQPAPGGDAKRELVDTLVQTEHQHLEAAVRVANGTKSREATR